jgi:hypothetical protein
VNFEPIRIRIMQEAYDCADRGETEAYNSIKVMYSDIQPLIEALVDQAVKKEREACAKVCDAADKATHPADLADAIRARGTK